MEKRHFTEKEKKLIGWAAIVIFVVFTAAVCWFVGRPMGKFVSEPEKFRLWVESHGLWSQAAYVGMVFLQVLVAVIPGEPLEISGGYALRCRTGYGAVYAGGLSGQRGGYSPSCARIRPGAGGDFFPQGEDRVPAFLQSSPKRDLLFWIVFVVPGTPKDLLCYFAGLTDLSWGKWLLICSAGRLPSIITSTVGGSAVGGRQYLFAILVFAGDHGPQRRGTADLSGPVPQA